MDDGTARKEAVSNVTSEGNIASCNVCPSDDAFKVPWDHIGAELMKAHFADKHPEIELPGGKR